MNPKKIVMGIIVLAVFWVFQAGYLSSLGTAEWFVGAVVLSILMAITGKFVIPKSEPAVAQLWQFAMAFVIVSAALISFAMPVLGAQIAGITPGQITAMNVSMWLVVFGAAMVATGSEVKKPAAKLVGFLWLFSAIPLVASPLGAANAYLHLGLVVGLTFILGGLTIKD